MVGTTLILSWNPIKYSLTLTPFGVDIKASTATSVRGPPPGITFDRFVRACVVVKQLSEAFQRLDTDRDGWIQINYDQFMETVLSLPWNADDGEGRKEYHTLLFVIMDSFFFSFSLNSVYVFSFNSPHFNKKETHLYVWFIYDRTSKCTPAWVRYLSFRVPMFSGFFYHASTLPPKNWSWESLCIYNYSGTNTISKLINIIGRTSVQCSPHTFDSIHVDYDYPETSTDKRSI